MLAAADPSSPSTPTTIGPVPVLTPKLSITKPANVATANPGNVVSYQITVTDSGQTSYTPAIVTDDLSGVLDDASCSTPTRRQSSPPPT